MTANRHPAVEAAVGDNAAAVRRRVLGRSFAPPGIRTAACTVLLLIGPWMNLSSSAREPFSIDTSRLVRHVVVLADSIGERHVWRAEALGEAAAYIESEFRKSGYHVNGLTYEVAGTVVTNLEGALPGSGAGGEAVVIGAHYDTVVGCPGANDNASGVAALLEIARVLADRRPTRSLRFVAFVNEEPPFFQTDLMGSRRYARACASKGEKITGMLSLETLGYYSSEPGSQRYPFPFSLFYPSTGNFAGFVGNLSSRSLVGRVKRAFERNSDFPCESAAVPGWLTGIGWSDHWSFWKAGYAALMVTDTALFRYDAYHTREDTPDRVDFESLARVAAGLVWVAADLAGIPIAEENDPD
ncbi:MAG: M28 family peptidase [bacterium]